MNEPRMVKRLPMKEQYNDTAVCIGWPWRKSHSDHRTENNLTSRVTFMVQLVASIPPYTLTSSKPMPHSHEDYSR